MKRIHASLAIAAAIGSAALFTQPAAAETENIGNQGQFVISAERLTGFYIDKLTATVSGQDSTTTLTRFGLLTNTTGGPGGAIQGVPVSAPSSQPRLGFDYLVTDGISVGGSLFYSHNSGSVDAGGNSQDQGSISTFFINPRVGYAYAFDETFGIWPRAGFAYSSSSYSPPSGSGGSLSSSQLTLEADAFISPIEHVAILVGPFVDIGVGGSLKDDASNTSIDTKLTTFGLTAGLGAYF